MSLNSHTIILPRAGENRIAVVNCSCKGSNNEAMNAIVKGVTAWIEKTDEGKVAWSRTSEDYNIADLEIDLECNTEGSTELSSFLAEAGVYNIEIQIFGDSDYPSNYTYDTVLAEGL
jgi:hypothetical protein